MAVRVARPGGEQRPELDAEQQRARGPERRLHPQDGGRVEVRRRCGQDDGATGHDRGDAGAERQLAAGCEAVAVARRGAGRARLRPAAEGAGGRRRTLAVHADLVLPDRTVQAPCPHRQPTRATLRPVGRPGSPDRVYAAVPDGPTFLLWRRPCLHRSAQPPPWKEEPVRITPVTGDLPAIATAPPPPLRHLAEPPPVPVTPPVADTSPTDTGAGEQAGSRRPPNPEAVLRPAAHRAAGRARPADRLPHRRLRPRAGRDVRGRRGCGRARDAQAGRPGLTPAPTRGSHAGAHAGSHARALAGGAAGTVGGRPARRRVPARAGRAGRRRRAPARRA